MVAMLIINSRAVLHLAESIISLTKCRQRVFLLPLVPLIRNLTLVNIMCESNDDLLMISVDCQPVTWYQRRGR